MGKSGGEEYVVGYKYFVGIHFVVCHGPVDSFINLKVDEKIVWIGDQDTTWPAEVLIDAPELWGGDEKAGGMEGTLTINEGAPTQPVDTYLQSILGSELPAFRGVVSLVWEGGYVGNAPHLAPWSFRLTRIHSKDWNGTLQWYDAKAEIQTYHMNPAHIIRECLTDITWGMGHPEEDLDDTAFMAVADALYDENFGLSLMWTRQIEINDFIMEILRHIDAVLYVDRTTGKFVLKLIRDDYDELYLPVLDESNTYRVKNYARPAIAELQNTVTIKYWDIETGADASLTIQDIALVIQQGASIATTVEYPGIANGTLAMRAAGRDLAALSTQLLACEIECNRVLASTFNVGDVFVFNWPKYGLAGTVMRIVNIRFGSQLQNSIYIDAVQDVFSITEPIYGEPPPTGWVQPVQWPGSAPYRSIHTSAYYEIASKIGDAEAQALDPTDAYMTVAASKPSSDAYSAQLWTSAVSGTGYTQHGVLDFCPTGILISPVSEMGASLGIRGEGTSRIPVGSFLVVDSAADFEVMEVTSVSDFALGVKRGCLDTIPHKHSSGDRYWMVQGFASSDYELHSQFEQIFVKVLPTTGKGTISIDGVPEDVYTFTNRQYLPYPPGNIKLNGEYYPAALTGDLVITWAHRDRLQQTAGIVDFTEASIGPESGTTYNLTVYNVTTSTSITTLTGLTGVTETVTQAGNWTEGDELNITLESQRDGVTSMQTYSHNVNGPVLSGGITIDATDTDYWAIGGTRTLLLGGTEYGEPFLTSYSEITTALDVLVGYGGNYIRNTMAVFGMTKIQGVAPFTGGVGSYDMTTVTNRDTAGTYWNYLKVFIEECAARGIVVHIELWDMWYYRWDSSSVNPWRPANNATYNTDSGMYDTYLYTPYDRLNPMAEILTKYIDGVPLHSEAYKVIAAQELFVSEILECASNHDNVIFEISNESSESTRWADYWADFIHARRANAIITHMDGNGDVNDSEARHAINTPSKYRFADASQNDVYASVDDYYTNLVAWVTTMNNSSEKRPVNQIKQYLWTKQWGDNWGDPVTEGLDRYGATSMTGTAGKGQHKHPDGLGGEPNNKGFIAIKSVRWLDDNCSLPSMSAVPVGDSKWGGRSAGEAYAMAGSSSIAVFMSSVVGGGVTFNVTELGASTVNLAWYNFDNNTANSVVTDTSSTALALNKPGGNNSTRWLCIITKAT